MNQHNAARILKLNKQVIEVTVEAINEEVATEDFIKTNLELIILNCKQILEQSP